VVLINSRTTIIRPAPDFAFALSRRDWSQRGRIQQQAISALGRPIVVTQPVSRANGAVVAWRQFVFDF